MRNDDSRPDPAAPVDLRPTPKMPLKRECTARGGVGYADDTTLSSTMVGGTAENTGIPMPTTAASARAIECKNDTLPPTGRGPSVNPDSPQRLVGLLQETHPQTTSQTAGQLSCALAAPALKVMIVDLALAGLLSAPEAEDLIAYYGLRHV
jgi:hypothetical protein